MRAYQEKATLAREERVLAANGAIAEAISDKDADLALTLIDELGSHRQAVARRQVYAPVGCSLLHYAVSQRLPGVVRKLVEVGAEIDVDSGDGTPAFIAAVQGELDTLSFLVECGANVSYRRADGPQTSLLMGAIVNDRTAVALALIDWGADWSDEMRSSAGCNAIEFALRRLNVDVYLRLGRLGAGECFGGPLRFAAVRGAGQLVKACLKDPVLGGPFLRGEQDDLIDSVNVPYVRELLLAARSEWEIGQALTGGAEGAERRPARSAPTL
jgi:hypothetical protein